MKKTVQENQAMRLAREFKKRTLAENWVDSIWGEYDAEEYLKSCLVEYFSGLKLYELKKLNTPQ